MSTGEASARLALECRLEQGVVVAPVTTEALPRGRAPGLGRPGVLRLGEC
jgi:hypothetical protein